MIGRHQGVLHADPPGPPPPPVEAPSRQLVSEIEERIIALRARLLQQAAAASRQLKALDRLHEALASVRDELP